MQVAYYSWKSNYCYLPSENHFKKIMNFLNNSKKGFSKTIILYLEIRLLRFTKIFNKKGKIKQKKRKRKNSDKNE